MIYMKITIIAINLVVIVMLLIAHYKGQKTGMKRHQILQYMRFKNDYLMGMIRKNKKKTIDFISLVYYAIIMLTFIKVIITFIMIIAIIVTEDRHDRLIFLSYAIIFGIIITNNIKSIKKIKSALHIIKSNELI